MVDLQKSGEAMATAEGYLRRLTRRLTEDPEQLDVEELTDEAASTGLSTRTRSDDGRHPAQR